jgi:hypothetical protein
MILNPRYATQKRERAPVTDRRYHWFRPQGAVRDLDAECILRRSEQKPAMVRMQLLA